MKIVALVFSGSFAVLAAAALSAPQARAVPLGQPCGGPGGATCDKGLWCEPPTGACFSTAGVCVAIPRLCFVRKNSKNYRPVCGCNAKTYSSDCFRRAYKVAKSYEGKCG
jgi:Kazal-type serine protease inhibitor domain